MSLILLANTIGEQATAFADTTGGTTTATGYDRKNAITGPRVKRWRSTTGTGAMGFGYTAAANMDADYAVYTDAWYAANALAGAQTFKTVTWNGTTWSALATHSYSGSLLGPKSQDYVYSMGAQSKRGFGFELTGSGGANEAKQIGKVYFCDAFEFGVNPEINPAPQWEELSKSERKFKPMQGHENYETERRITLTWKLVSGAMTTSKAFLSIPKLLEWPVFLYEDDASNIAIFEHRLEHVIVESYTINIVRFDLHVLQVTFRRLEHHDSPRT